MKTPFAIRRATLTDADVIAQLLSPLGYPTSGDDVRARWGAWEAAGNIALIISDDIRALGVITLHRTHVLHRPRPVGRITALAVDESAQGRGLGRALVAAAESELAGDGCGMVEVTSNVRREGAHAFYRHLGYDQTSFRFAKPLG